MRNSSPAIKKASCPTRLRSRTDLKSFYRTDQTGAVNVGPILPVIGECTTLQLACASIYFALAFLNYHSLVKFMTKQFRHIVAGLVTLSLSSAAAAQTAEQNLEQCMLAEIAKYQPISQYSNEFKCSVGNKRPGGSTPSKGPYAEALSYPGYLILNARADRTFQISDGGHTAPFISPRRDRVSLTLWCKAEDKWYGKTGKYNVRLSGDIQRLATGVEQRRALTFCTQSVSGGWTKTD